MKNIKSFEQFNEGFLGFGSIEPKVKEYISKANELVIKQTTLSPDMATDAVNILNRLNTLVDEILENKDIKKKDDVYKKILKVKKNIGSDKFGMNRCDDDHKCNASQIYLGNIKGLFTKDINFWLSGKKENEEFE
jgi:hypothetical protein